MHRGEVECHRGGNQTETVSRHEVTLIFGSNQGDRCALIERAMVLMEVLGEVKCASSLYETEPWGFQAVRLFYNRVVTYFTDFAPEEVLRWCLKTEQRLGRERAGVRYASRTMDIDILFYDSLVLSLPDLIIPHPRIALRNFVLIPLNEIMPDFIHPVSGKKIAELLVESPDDSTVHGVS